MPKKVKLKTPRISVSQKILLTIIPFVALAFLLDLITSYFTGRSIVLDPVFRLLNQNILIGFLAWIVFVMLSIYQIYWITRRIQKLEKNPMKRGVMMSFSITFLPYHWFYLWFQDDKLVENE